MTNDLQMLKAVERATWEKPEARRIEAQSAEHGRDKTPDAQTDFGS